MERVFEIESPIHIKVLNRRFAPLDDSASFAPGTLDDPVQEKIRYFLGVDTTLTDEEVTALLGPVTPEEQTYVDEFNADRRNFRTEYQNRIDTLKLIEDTATPTQGQMVNAIKYNAQTLRLLLRLLVKTRFDER